MFQALSAVVCMLLAALALWGWGRIAGRLANARASTALVNIAVGMAAIVFVGGVLNLLRIAYGSVLDGLVAIGVLFAIREWRVAGWPRPRLLARLMASRWHPAPAWCRGCQASVPG